MSGLALDAPHQQPCLTKQLDRPGHWHLPARDALPRDSHPHDILSHPTARKQLVSPSQDRVYTEQGSDLAFYESARNVLENDQENSIFHLQMH